MCLGQNWRENGPGRGGDRKGRKMHEQNGSGYKRLRHLCLDERETPGGARTDNLGTRESRHRQRKELRKVGPLDKTIWTSMGGATVQMCGDRKVVERWINWSVSKVIVDTLKIPRHGERYDRSGTGPKTNMGRVDAAGKLDHSL